MTSHPENLGGLRHDEESAWAAIVDDNYLLWADLKKIVDTWDGDGPSWVLPTDPDDGLDPTDGEMIELIVLLEREEATDAYAAWCAWSSGVEEAFEDFEEVVAQVFEVVGAELGDD